MKENNDNKKKYSLEFIKELVYLLVWKDIQKNIKARRDFKIKELD